MNFFEKDYDVYIRIRPDIILTNPIKIINLDLKGKIHIICSKNCNNGRWLHSRDWDHMVICNKTGYELWAEYYRFLKIESFDFNSEVRFNNDGYWNFGNISDKSIVATQLFFIFISENYYKLHFSSDSFTIPIR